MILEHQQFSLKLNCKANKILIIINYISYIMSDTIKSQGNAGTMGNTTMYNLQTKRTLPRDVIKWMQGLDLSYSVKDYRKDLSNGFLIGEIVSRYEPGKIPMHAFQNSHNQARRDNNWSLLALFFSKNELRKVKIEQAEFSKIKSNNDPKSEQLYEFICRLYSVCTKRNLPEATQTIQLPPTQSKNPNLTVSYLLKDDGLQKLQNSQVSAQSNGELQKSGEGRVPTRKISPNIDSPARVDVKGIGVKQQINRKLTSKKKSWQAKSESYYEQSNPYVQKYVFDYLNEILEDYIHQEDMDKNLKQTFQKSECKPTQTLIKNLPLQSKLFISFLASVKSSANQILAVMLKDLNEIWKFFTYFIKMLSAFPGNSQQFHELLKFIVDFATGSNINQKKKITKVFLESLIDGLINQVKNAAGWYKKERIMDIIYDFSGRDIQDKKAVLFSLKEKLGSNNPLYISWLAVLVRQEKSTSGNQKLVQDFIYYAHQNLNSSNSSMRNSALKILSVVATNGWINLIESYFSQQSTLRRFRCITDFQSIYFSSQIYFNLLKWVIQSPQYQSLVKGKTQGNSSTIKVYNPDHQRQTEQIKHKVQSISITISYLYHNSTSQIARETIAKQATNYIIDSNPLMLIVVYHMGSLKYIQEFIKQDSVSYQFKTTVVVVAPANVGLLREYANDIIGELVQIRDQKRNTNLPDNADINIEIKQQLALMNFCLQNINVKKLNIELWQSIGQNFCKQVAQSLKQQKFCDAAWSILQKIYLIIFNYDMKMAYLNVWVAESVNDILDSNKGGNQITDRIRDFFKEQYKNANIEEVKISSQEINDILQEKGKDRFIVLEKEGKPGKKE